MPINRFHRTAVIGWFAVLVAIVVTRLAVGIPTTFVDIASLFLLACIPALVLLAVFRGAPPRNVTQMLYDIEHTAGTAAPARARTDAANEPAHSGATDDIAERRS